MSTGKVKAVLFIIIGLLIIALICSWLAGKDNSTKGPVNISSTGSDSAAVTPAPGENAPTTSDGTSSYTGTGSNAALNGYINGGTGSKNNTGSNANANTGSNANANTNTGSNANVGSNAGIGSPDNAGTANNETGFTGGNAEIDLGKDSTNPQPELTPAPEPGTPGFSQVVGADGSVPASEPDPSYTRRKLGGTQTFHSESFGGLSVRTEVSCETISSTQVEVKIDLFVESYSIYLHENYGGAGVSLGDVFSTMTTNAVQKDNNDHTATYIGSKTFVVEITDGNTLTLPVQVEYYYNGSYNGIAVGTIECGGQYTIKRA